MRNQGHDTHPLALALNAERGIGCAFALLDLYANGEAQTTEQIMGVDGRAGVRHTSSPM